MSRSLCLTGYEFIKSRGWQNDWLKKFSKRLGVIDSRMSSILLMSIEFLLIEFEDYCGDVWNVQGCCTKILSSL